MRYTNRMEISWLIRELDAEIGRLQQAKLLLIGNSDRSAGTKGSSFGVRKERVLSPEARADRGRAEKALGQGEGSFKVGRPP